MITHETSTRKCFTAPWLAPLLVLGTLADLGAGALPAFAQSRITLPGHVPAAVSKAISATHENGNSHVNLALVLPLRNQTQLKDLLHGLYDPFDSRYHHFLTPQQFADQFAPSQADYDALIEFAQQNGLKVTHTYGNRALLDVSGPVSSVESAFQVHLNRYATSAEKSFVAPDADPSVPSAVANDVTGIVGLDSAAVPSDDLHAVDTATMSVEGSGPSGGLTPSNTKTAYNLSKVTYNGKGERIALVELDGFLQSDISLYDSTFKLPQVTPSVTLLDGASGVPDPDLGGQPEVTLDIDMAQMLAPNVNIAVYETAYSIQGLIDCYNLIATNDTEQVVSTSWGASEAELTPSQLSSEYASFEEMAAQGQSMFVASADAGAFDDFIDLSIVDPAGQPYVTAVGATNINLNSKFDYVSETSWGDTSDLNFEAMEGAGGGGGVSQLWPIPDYQAGVVSVASLGSTTYRNIPDVSLYGDFDSGGYDIAINGVWQPFNGTSAAAPLWASFTALADQERGSEGPIGFMNPVLYQIGQSANYGNDFHDVADGSTNLYYPAVQGYDLSTGWGTFNGANLLTDLAPTSKPSAPSDVSATAGNEEAFLNWTAVVGASSYNVDVATSSSGPFSSAGTVIADTYAVTGLTNGKTYYFKVDTANDRGTSSYSSVVKATPAAALAAPANLQAYESSGTIALIWSPVNGAGSYNIYRVATQGTEAYSLAGQGTIDQTPYETGVTSTEFIDTGLANGTSYFYTVAAVGAVVGPQSAEVNAIPIAHPQPIGPVAVDTSNPITSGMVLCAPLDLVAALGGVKNLVDGTTATVGPGWQWTITPEGIALGGNGNQAPAYFTPASVPTGDYSIFVIGKAINSNLFADEQDGLASGGYGAVIGSTGVATNYPTLPTSSIDNLNNQLVHVALVRSPWYQDPVDFGGDSVYLNGTVVGEGFEFITDPLITSFPNRWAIGGGQNAPGPNIDGYVAYVAVWNRALLPSEVATLNADPYSILKPAL